MFVAATARLWRWRLTSRGSFWPGRLCAGPGAAARWLFSPRPAFWLKRKVVILKMWKFVSVSCWEGIMRRAGGGWLTLLFLYCSFFRVSRGKLAGLAARRRKTSFGCAGRCIGRRTGIVARDGAWRWDRCGLVVMQWNQLPARYNLLALHSCCVSSTLQIKTEIVAGVLYEFFFCRRWTRGL